LDWFIPIFPDHITAVSPELKEWFLAQGVPAGKVDMVPAGIEPQLFDHPEPEKFRQQYQLNGQPVVMYTGVLNAFQRVDYLLRAFAVALQAKPDALLLIVSPLVNLTHEKEHKQLADQLGISHSIIWVAPHALAELPSYLALADVTVVPRPECPGHPVKLLNYMLAGKPVVSFAGGAKGVRHLHDAFIVPNHDYEALGRGIITLLQDRALAAELGVNARATVLADFDWRQICRKIECIYDQLLGTASTASQPLNQSPTGAALER
jgi:1,2-diacylglycerol 3-alpha-glucosyltransferase